jgi:hypothetical protein
MDLARHAKLRAAKKSLPYDLSDHVGEIQSRINAGVCEVTGLPLNLDGGRTWDSPSLDRIVPSVGYLYTNIRIVCHAMNGAMGDWGEQKVIEMALAVLGKRKERSNALSMHLGEVLRKNLEGRVSTLFKLTWSQRDTPSGHRFWQQRASALRTSGSASTGWATPAGHEAGGTPEQFLARKVKTRENGAELGVSLTSLSLQAQLAGWPTTRQADGAKNVRTLAGPMREIARKGGPQDLAQASQLAPWPTPNAARAERGGQAKRTGQGRSNPIDTAQPADSGPTPSGSHAPTERRGQLNPNLSRYLMGFPVAWDLCALQVIPRMKTRKLSSSRLSLPTAKTESDGFEDTETPSSSKSPPSSSERP